MITDINNEDRLVQATFADHLRDVLGWDSIYAHIGETFAAIGRRDRASEREVVLIRDLRAAVQRLNPDLPESAREQAIDKLTRVDFGRSLIQQNRESCDLIRNGVPVGWRTTMVMFTEKCCDHRRTLPLIGREQARGRLGKLSGIFD